MKIRDLHIEGFGVLTGLPIDDLGEGLTVIHGPNGAGKTTLLQFVRGLFLGYAEARRLRLLPPLKGGTPGGSAVVVTGSEGRFTLVRHNRADTSDTLAINIRQGEPDEARRLRLMIEGLNSDLIRNLYAVGNLESHNLGFLVQLAERDGIDFASRRREASWLRGQVDAVHRERSDLFEVSPQRGRLAELESEKDRLRNRIEEHLRQGRERHEDHAARLRQLREQQVHAAAEIERLDLELQSVQSQLTECHDRLWGRTQRTIRESRFVEEEQVVVTTGRIPEIDELDRQIEHCRQVLRDLAASRHSLSVESAALAGVETPDEPVTFDRERGALRVLEGQLHRLDGLVEEVLEALSRGQCLCESTQGALSRSSETMREQVYVLCQDLNRRQKEAERRSLLARRKGVDRIELELEDRIRGLRWKREALLAAQQQADRERIRHRTHLEAADCECGEHAAWVERSSRTTKAVRTAPLETFVDRTVEESTARPGDGELALQLAARKSELWNELAEVRRRAVGIERALAGATAGEAAFAEDRTLQRLQFDYAVLEQQVADAREQWQSLALLQATLLHARRQLEQETHPQVVIDASKTFRTLTQGRYAGFRYNVATRELCVEPAHGELQTIPSLSRGTLDQAALSLRLALAEEYARRGFRFPLVLDDVLVDTDEGRLRLAVEVLREAAGRGQQILFLTCQDHLAELFHGLGVSVRGLNSAWQSGRRPAAVAPLTESPPAIGAAFEASFLLPSPARKDFAPAPVIEELPSPLPRSQPDTPFWLQPDSPVSLIPSLGSQMGRRLGAIGVSSVIDLIDLDPESAEIPLASLQVSAAQLRAWQAEGRLLCCVPDLNGRDAQLLVACGLMSPSELAESDPIVLWNRIDRLRSSNVGGAFNWLQDRSFAPTLEAVRHWIGQSQRSRTLRDALGEVDWSGEEEDGRDPENELEAGPQANLLVDTSDGDDGDDPDPTTPTGSSTLVRRSRRSGMRRPNRSRLRGTGRSALRVRGPSAQASSTVVASDPGSWRFYLHPESLVVEAPSIGPKMAERLREIGVLSVSDLLGRSAATISAGLNDSRIPEEAVADWKRQAALMCRIPELRGHDSQVLVACGIDSAEKLAAISPSALWEIVQPFIRTREAARLLRSSTPPDLEEVTNWVRWANHSRALRAA